MIPEILILIIGLFILIKTSKWVIEYAVRFSDITGLSHGTTGFLLLAVATSLPELSISIISIFNDSSRIAAGTLFGANIIDIGVVFGITALISGFKIIKKDFDQISHAIIITSIIAVFALVLGTMNIVFGIFCIIMFVVSIKAVLEGGREFEEKEEKNVLVSVESIKIVLLILLMIGIIIVSAKFVSDSAIKLAETFGMGKTLIGATIVALGTTLPELFVNISAVKRNNFSLAIGNVIGSLVVNLTLTLGIAVAANKIIIDSTLKNLIIFLLIFNSILLLFAWRGRIRRIHGIFLIVLYAMIYVMLLV